MSERLWAVTAAILIYALAARSFGPLATWDGWQWLAVVSMAFLATDFMIHTEDDA